MTSREQFEEQLREALAEAVDCVQLRMDDPQSWPAILTYADTIESDDPDEAERLRHLVLCYKNGVEVPNFGLVETLMKSLDEPVAPPSAS